MKVRIKPNLISEFCDHYRCGLDKASQIVGLSEKTLRALDHGGLHKVETAFQFESALGELLSNSWAGIWTTQLEAEVVPSRMYSECSQFDSITESTPIDGERCFAISLPSSGLIKLIETRAQSFKSRCDPETASDSVDPLRDQRLLAYDNYLWYASFDAACRMGGEMLNLQQQHKTSLIGIPEQFRYTIQDSLLPLTKAQANCVQLLNQAIKELVDAARETKDSYFDSFLMQMESKGVEPKRKSLMALVAKLKRLNINVLAYSRSKKVRVFDDTYEREIDTKAPDNLLPKDYLFTMYTGVTHIVLAPSNILRVPFFIPKYEPEWEPEPMWQCKTMDGSKPVSQVYGLPLE